MTSDLKQIIGQHPSYRSNSITEIFNCSSNFKAIPSIQFRLKNQNQSNNDTSDSPFKNSPTKSEDFVFELKNLREERNMNKLRKLINGAAISQIDPQILNSARKIQNQLSTDKALSANIINNISKEITTCNLKKSDNFLSNYEDKIHELFLNSEKPSKKSQNIPQKTINLKYAQAQESQRSQIAHNAKNNKTIFSLRKQSDSSTCNQKAQDCISYFNFFNKFKQENFQKQNIKQLKGKLNEQIKKLNFHRKFNSKDPKSNQIQENQTQKPSTLQIAGLEFTIFQISKTKQNKFKSSSFANTIEKGSIEKNNYCKQCLNQQHKSKVEFKKGIQKDKQTLNKVITQQQAN